MTDLWETVVDPLGEKQESARPVSRRPVTVVVPVFNGLGHVERCLEALAQSTSSDVSLLVIDDASTDTRVPSMLAEWSSVESRRHVIRNPANLGYVSSVNRGIRAASTNHDIVLLNSDTVPVGAWLHRLRIAASSRANVASVSPMSNAAGVFSLPDAYGDRPLPEDITPQQAYALLAMFTRAVREEVPVSCGFCMYLTREALREIGVFDERLFARGYGEENDWCERAIAAQFVHLIDDTCFVNHIHGASFGAEKAWLKKRNGNVLKALFPRHIEDTKSWLAQSRLDETRNAYGRALAALSANRGGLEAAVSDRRILQIQVGATHESAPPDTIRVGLDAPNATVDLFGRAHYTREIGLKEGQRDFFTRLIRRWHITELDASEAFDELREELH